MKLFIIHVGYYDYEVGMYELHSQFLICAQTASEAKAKVVQKEIFVKKKMHIDGIQEITQVDGYQLNFTATNNQVENKVYSYNEIKQL